MIEAEELLRSPGALLVAGGLLVVLFSVAKPAMLLGRRLLGLGAATSPDSSDSVPNVIPTPLDLAQEWERSPTSAPPPCATEYILSMADELADENAGFILDQLCRGATLHEALRSAYDSKVKPDV